MKIMFSSNTLALLLVLSISSMLSISIKNSKASANHVLRQADNDIDAKKSLDHRSLEYYISGDPDDDTIVNDHLDFTVCECWIAVLSFTTF